ncbi:MAG: stage III sporulation protein AC [Anaerovoracaceae bacterium]
MEIDIIFKIAAIGIAVAVLEPGTDKSRQGGTGHAYDACPGVVVVLVLVIQMISEFFDAVKTFLNF